MQKWFTCSLVIGSRPDLMEKNYDYSKFFPVIAISDWFILEKIYEREKPTIKTLCKGKVILINRHKRR